MEKRRHAVLLNAGGDVLSMIFDSGYHCIFVDHRSSSIEELGALLSSLNEKNEAGEDHTFFATCQRFERYAFLRKRELYINFPLTIAKPNIISGPIGVLRRLSLIACGAESLLLGESFITSQISRAFSGISSTSPLFSLSQAAIEISENTRKEHDFYASRDYADISLDILPTIRRGCGRRPRQLVVIGSGMLGRAIAAHQGAMRYERVLFVSRWPKELRKKMRNPHILCVSPHAFFNRYEGSAFDLAIAVDNADGEYLSFIVSIIKSADCLSAIDLSTTPIVTGSRPSYYMHEYDAEFINFLLEQNQELRKKLNAVRASIEAGVHEFMNSSRICRENIKCEQAV